MSYKSTQISRNGYTVPILENGSACHSLYDPIQEASRRITVLGSGFVVFAGIGGGFLIREYLKKFPNVHCIVIESSDDAIHDLRQLIHIEDIINDSRITLITDVQLLETVLLQYYQPAIDGGFSLVELIPWTLHYPLLFSEIKKKVTEVLKRISADYSVQSHFGKVWLRNILENIQIASKNKPMSDIIVKTKGVEKKVLVVAAGPSLENHIDIILSNREEYVLFATDTAYSTLISAGIIADYFVSIDGQAISYSHILRGLDKKTTCILDLCANPVLGRVAIKHSCEVLFFASAHPLAQFIGCKFSLPSLITGSGTVTVAAKGVALALGYTNVECIGADFSYTRGKPYARDTYLAHLFHTISHRCSTAETKYSQLMFRSPVVLELEDNKISYKTEILDRYKEELHNFELINVWNLSKMISINYSSVFSDLYTDLLLLLKNYSREATILRLFLPFFAWHRKSYLKNSIDWNIELGIKLALDVIARYTNKS